MEVPRSLDCLKTIEKYRPWPRTTGVTSTLACSRTARNLSLLVARGPTRPLALARSLALELLLALRASPVLFIKFWMFEDVHLVLAVTHVSCRSIPTSPTIFTLAALVRSRAGRILPACHG